MNDFPKTVKDLTISSIPKVSLLFNSKDCEYKDHEETRLFDFMIENHSAITCFMPDTKKQDLYGGWYGGEFVIIDAKPTPTIEFLKLVDAEYENEDMSFSEIEDFANRFKHLGEGYVTAYGEAYIQLKDLAIEKLFEFQFKLPDEILKEEWFKDSVNVISQSRKARA